MASDEGRTQKAKEMTLEEAKSIVAAQSHYKRWENIVDEFHGTDDYSEYLEKAANLCIASLESQLREKDEKYNKLWELFEKQTEDKLMKDKEIEAFKDIENIRSQATKNLCKENYDLRDEIERLKDIIKSKDIIQEDDALLIGDLREALRQALVKAGHQMHGDLLDRCRKLIGD